MSLFQIEYNAKYPKVNYIGNKEKLSKWIVDNFPVKSGIVLDLFSGGASVSFEAKKHDYTVYSNDALYASYVVSKTLIENKGIIVSEKMIEEALSICLDDNERKEFEWLDNYLFFPNEVDELAKLISFSKTLVEYEKYFFQSLIRRAIIRKLPYSRMNVDWKNIKKLRNEEYSYQKYGRKRAYHNESFSSHMKANLLDYQAAVFDNGHENKAFQKDAVELLECIDHVDIIYMDPPYPSTMNNYDSFYGNFGKMFNRTIDHIDLARKDSFLINLRRIVELSITKTDYIVLSLNSKSKPSVEDIEKLFTEFGKTRVISRKHNYQVSGKKMKNQNIELLVILEINKK
ncbi:DNA adenine methylase [Streptococcus suis]|uniref:DNA adenine methylase n=1 Tax=Streptococcus suis TaxID=1307 RepID=UPI0003F72407|nr:DNA adenine methylase [Streptococcus suis]CYV21606.1 DNA adenine methylase [Streptococcus suis]